MPLFRCGNSNNSNSTGDKLSHIAESNTKSCSVNLTGGEAYYLVAGGHTTDDGVSPTITSSNGDKISMQMFQSGVFPGSNTCNGRTTAPYIPTSDTTVTYLIGGGVTSADECFLAAIHSDHLG